jgi:hypothetical protein
VCLKVAAKLKAEIIIGERGRKMESSERLEVRDDVWLVGLQKGLNSSQSQIEVNSTSSWQLAWTSETH